MRKSRSINVILSGDLNHIFKGFKEEDLLHCVV